jgi:hypothetical protein
MMHKKIPVTVNNLACALVYDLYQDIMDKNYLIDCHESKAQEYIRCIKLLSQDTCEIDLDCYCDEFNLYEQTNICNPTVITCDLQITVNTLTQTGGCTEPIILNINTL